MGEAFFLIRSNDELVDELVARRAIKTRLVERAFRAVDRALFVPPALRSQAYEDCALPVMLGQTISQPFIVATMTEALELRGGERVLDVGTGSGYQAAILAEVVGRKGGVFGVERLRPLFNYAKQRLAKYENIALRCGDGSLGWKAKAPFDRALVAAACPRLPQPIAEQTCEGGIIVAPVEGMLWLELAVFRKMKSGGLKKRSLMPVVFVPLVGECAYKDESVFESFF
ncbi:MAG: protein-L-isoaspartate(D-aspartate) O-methyltransferase [Candidatus Norongarragalinales archaeon]